MNNSTQITAFLVLIAGLIGAMLLINRQEISSDVNTVEETRLPQVYDSPSQALQGVSFRYPRGWNVTEAGPTRLNLSRPQDMAERLGEQYEFTLDFFQEPEALTPVNLLGEGEAVEVTTFGGFPAAQETTTTEEQVDYRAAILLDNETTYLSLASTKSIPADEWNELSEDVERILNSVEVSEDFSYTPPIFTYTLPPNWVVEAAALTALRFNSPANPNAFEAQMELYLFESDEAATEALRNVLGLQQDPTFAEITATRELLEALAQTAPEQLTVSEVSYFGLDGSEMAGTNQNVALNFASVVTEEGYTIVIQKVVSLASPNLETLLSEQNAILEAMQYTAPDPTIFEQ